MQGRATTRVKNKVTKKNKKFELYKRHKMSIKLILLLHPSLSHYASCQASQPLRLSMVRFTNLFHRCVHRFQFNNHRSCPISNHCGQVSLPYSQYWPPLLFVKFFFWLTLSLSHSMATRETDVLSSSQNSTITSLTCYEGSLIPSIPTNSKKSFTNSQSRI